MDNHQKKVTSTRLARYIWLLAFIWTALFVAALIWDVSHTKALISEFSSNRQSHILLHTTTLFTLWVLGMAGLVWGGRRLTAQMYQQEQAEIALQQERQLFVGGPVVVFKWQNQPNWPVEYVSDNVAQVLGYSPRQFLSGEITYIDLIHTEDVDRVSAEVQSAAQAKADRFTHKPYRVTRQDGQIIWLTDHTTVIRTETGQITHYLGYVIDITDRMDTEQALRAGEERLNMVLDGAKLGLWDWNIQTGDVVFNERWAEMLGYTLAEIEPHVDSWSALMHPDDAAFVLDVLQEHLEGRTPVYQTEHRILHKSGDWVWVFDSGKVVERDAAGQPLRAAGIHMDITSRKEAETALQASRASLAKSQEIAHLGNWEWNIQTDESTWSDEIYRIFGVEPQQFGPTYKASVEFIHPEDRSRVTSALDKAIRGDQPYNLDLRIIRPDGLVRIVHEQGKVVYDEKSGQPVYMLGNTQDVTEQKEAEAALKSWMSRLETLIQSLQSGILMEDAQRKVTLHNEAFNGIFGLPSSMSLVGGDCKDAAEEMKMMFNEPEQFASRIVEIIQQQQPVMGEELSVADGRALERDYVPVYTEGQLAGHLWHYRDITERVRTREQIKASLQEKEILLKEIHHRVKNNLQIVASLLYLQSSRIHDPATMAAIQESSDRIRSMSLIHEQLYQSRNLAAIDFHDYLSSLVAYLSQIYRSKEGRIDIYVQAKDINLEVDTAVTLGLIINELVSNALKHAFPNDHDGRVDIQLTRTQPNTCTLTVRDNGIGFVPDVVERLEKEGVRALHGNSLGIKLVDTLTQQIDGEIVIHSHNGAVFEISFPLAA
jgi:PAS domain S-box-containing protein